MAGQLTIDTLKASTGVLATQNGMTGIAKSWVDYDGVAQVVRASFNVSSVTYNGTGSHIINFTTAMPSAYYCATLACSGTAVGGGQYNFLTSGMLTTSCQVDLANYLASSATNRTNVYVAIFSS
jgi:hypothetical protein